MVAILVMRLDIGVADMDRMSVIVCSFRGRFILVRYGEKCICMIQDFQRETVVSITPMGDVVRNTQPYRTHRPHQMSKLNTTPTLPHDNTANVAAPVRQ